MKQEHDLNLFIIHMSVDIFKQIQQLKIYHKYMYMHVNSQSQILSDENLKIVKADRHRRSVWCPLIRPIC